MWVQSLGQEEPLEEGMTTHSSILAWRIPMDRGDGGLQFIGSQRVGHNLTTKKQQQQTCIFCSCRYFDVLSFSELFIFLVSCVNSWVSHTKLWDGYQICLVTSLRADLISVWVCVRARTVMSWLFATPWTVAHQAPLSMGFSRQEYWSGLPLPSPGALPNPGVEPVSLVSPVLAGLFFTTAPPGKPLNSVTLCHGEVSKNVLVLG